jgi:hypothetical protein
MDGKFLGVLCGHNDLYQSHGIENCLLFCLLFTKRFHEGDLGVMISLFLSLCESLRINIMFIVFLLNGREWCELWNKGGNTTTKGMRNLKLNTLIGFVWIVCCRVCIHNG